jgi:hypothetical protein
MVMEFRHMIMVDTKDSVRMRRVMDLAFIIGMMELSMKDSGRKVKHMDMV